MDGRIPAAVCGNRIKAQVRLPLTITESVTNGGREEFNAEGRRGGAVNSPIDRDL